MRHVFHFAEDSDTSGFFPQLGRWHDRERYRMTFGTLKPIAPWLRDYMHAQGVETFSLDCKGRLDYPLGVLRLASYLRRSRVDLVHAHLFDPCLVGLTAAKLAGTPRRVMTRHHSDYHTRINKRFHVKLDQLNTALSDRVIAVSEHTAEVMREQEGAPAGKIRVVLNGIDFDRVRVSSPEAPAALRAEFAPDGEFLMLHVGRIHPEKGYPQLFDAMALVVKEAKRPVRLLIAGTGPQLEAYRDQVRARGLAGQVRLLGFRKDIADLMAAADLMILASVAEAFGLVLAEAIYMGTPVLATRAGGIPEIVSDGVDGLLVPPASAPALAEGILTMVSDDALRERLRGAGREKVLRTFSFEKMMREYESVYDELFALKKRGAPCRACP